jgi:hypothetical protein
MMSVVELMVHESVLLWKILEENHSYYVPCVRRHDVTLSRKSRTTMCSAHYETISMLSKGG